VPAVLGVLADLGIGVVEIALTTPGALKALNAASARTASTPEPPTW
jgi:2-keto-3-deoxy-6-phosphogluconate aldolase